MMKKQVLVLLFFWVFSTFSVGAVTPEEQQTRLFYTAKFWGFVKYFHPLVNQCKVNWDSILMARIPQIKSVSSSDSVNLVFMEMLSLAGPVSNPGTPRVTKPDSLNRNLQLTWMHSNWLSAGVQNALDTLWEYFRPGQNCYVSNNDNTDPNNRGWLMFKGDQGKYTGQEFPQEAGRLLMLFRYWNIIEYFHPSKVIADKPWDSTLFRSILPVMNAQSGLEYAFAMAQCNAGMDDTHAFFNSTLFTNSFGTYYPSFQVKRIENAFVVTAVFDSLFPDISLRRGDVITAVNGKNLQHLADSLRRYFSVSNTGSYYNNYMTQLFRQSTANLLQLEVIRNGQSMQCLVPGNLSGTNYYNMTRAKGDAYYLLPGCGFGYVNMNLLTQSQVYDMYTAFINLPGIVFDLRAYPNGTAWAIMNSMLPGKRHFATLSLPDVRYPGTVSYDNDSIGINGNSNAYTGDVFVLVNENTLSQAEYSTMMFQQHPNTTVIGSQTSGADGNITQLNPVISPLYTNFSTLRVLYPDGFDTQRAGVRINKVVKPTIAGIRAGRDEVLEAVDPRIQTGLTHIAQSPVWVYPNPAEGIVNLQTQHRIRRLILIDLQGKAIQWACPQTTGIQTLDLRELPAGVYSLQIETDAGMQTQRLSLVK